MMRILILAMAALLLTTYPLYAQHVDDDDVAIMKELGIKPLFEGE